jgi:hypothetical protein
MGKVGHDQYQCYNACSALMHRSTNAEALSNSGGAGFRPAPTGSFSGAFLMQVEQMSPGLRNSTLENEVLKRGITG